MMTLAAQQSELVRDYMMLGYCPSCGVIDLHGHYGPWPGIYLPRAGEAAMLASMERCGIATLVSSGHNALADMAIGNPEMAAIARRHPGRWYAYLVCNPRYPAEMEAQLATFDGEPAYVDLIYNNLIDLKADGSFRMNMDYFGYVDGLTMTNDRFATLFGGPARKPVPSRANTTRAGFPVRGGPP